MYFEFIRNGTLLFCVVSVSKDIDLRHDKAIYSDI